MSNEKAKLTYPVGLLTADEVNLAGSLGVNDSYYLYTGQTYWTSSSASFSDQGAGIFVQRLNGNSSTYSVRGNNGVRPSVSLAVDTYYSDGNGSVEDPYVVETN